jgi:hypothetical protein
MPHVTDAVNGKGERHYDSSNPGLATPLKFVLSESPRVQWRLSSVSPTVSVLSDSEILSANIHLPTRTPERESIGIIGVDQPQYNTDGNQGD